MARWGKVDCRQLKAFHEKLGKLAQADAQKFCEEAARELAARLLAMVIKRTPVGRYDRQIARGADGQKIRLKSGKNKGRYKKTTVKKGGTLRRGWTAKTESEAKGGGNPDVAAYAQGLKVTRQSGWYTIEIVNPVYYGNYVEFGHRTAGGKGWVKGRYMLTISEKEIQAMMPALLEQKLAVYLKGCFDGQ